MSGGMATQRGGLHRLLALDLTRLGHWLLDRAAAPAAEEAPLPAGHITISPVPRVYKLGANDSIGCGSGRWGWGGTMRPGAPCKWDGGGEGGLCGVTHWESAAAPPPFFRSRMTRYMPRAALKSHAMAAMKQKARMVRQMLHLLEPQANLQTKVCQEPPQSGLNCHGVSSVSSRDFPVRGFPSGMFKFV